MIIISNTDRDRAVEYIRAYVSMLDKRGTLPVRLCNKRRMARKLAMKLEGRKPFPSKPDGRRICRERRA